jgi:cytochrome c oxidase subunit III
MMEKAAMAEAQAKHHPYHLVDPSPWPVFGAFSALLLAIGLITWMHHMTSAAPMMFAAGALGVACTMFGWWHDVIREAEYEHRHTPVVQLSLHYGMILFIASEVMFFVAWFWAYFNTSLFPADVHEFVRNEFIGGQWPPKGIQTFNPWRLPLVNTLILLISSATITWAQNSLLKNNRTGLKLGLFCTILLGLSFTCIQISEYSHAQFAFKGNIYGATFFMATGFHGVHVIIGTIFLIVCLGRALAGQFTPKQHLGLEFASWYWHFVDFVWLFLFASIYVWGSVSHLSAAAAH